MSSSTYQYFAIDCTSFIKGKSGGFESFLLNLLDGVHNLSSINLYLFVRNNQCESFTKYHKFKIIPVNINNTLFLLIWQNFIFPFYCFHFHAVIFPADFRPIYFPTKSITIFNDFQHLYFPQYWGFNKILYRKIFCFLSLFLTTKAVAISNTVKKEILDNFKKQDVEVIYIPISDLLPIEPNVFQRSITNEFGCERFFLIPSSLAPHKNLINLQKAICNLGEISNGIKFIFTGPYSKDNFIFEKANPSIHVLGYVEKKELNLLYQQCSGVILPSIYEGFGMPYIESVNFNKNILICRIPITVELFGEHPFYIESPFCSNQIWIALNKFLKNCDTHISKEKYSYIKSVTNQNFVAQKYIEILHNL
jgi:glycosyltransferase involved in cell wall biosynthesis